MPNMTVGNDEIEAAYVGDVTINKIYMGSVLVYTAYRDPKMLIDADEKNVIDSDGNQIFVY